MLSREASGSALARQPRPAASAVAPVRPSLPQRPPPLPRAAWPQPRRPASGRGRALPAPPPRASSEQQQQTAAASAAEGGSHVANSVATPAGTFALGSFLSLRPDAASAVAEAVEAITSRHGPCFQPTLAVVFAAAAYGDGLEEVVPALRQLLPSLRHVFGCTSFGVVGSATDAPADAEGVAGLSLVLGALPGVEVSVTHTLRSGIPDEDASPEAWSDLVGMEPGSQAHTSFLVLADPKFQQTRPLLAGLDFAFPSATKVGGVISSGQRYKRRAMYAWSADGPVRAGEGRRQAARQRQRSSAAGEQQQTAQPTPTQQQQAQRPRQGLLGSFFSRLTGNFAEEPAPGRSGSAAEPAQPPASDAAADEGGDDVGGDAGLHMYGAAVLALRGPAYFEPITSQGYRAVGNRSWVVGRVSRDGSAIYSLLDPEEAARAGGDAEEVLPLVAMCEMLESASLGSEEGDLSASELDELSDDRVWVAIAPDALAADADIAPEDYQMMKLTDYDEAFGAVGVDGQVRSGYRLKLVLRDPEGIRADLAERLLATKRGDLAAVLAGAPRPPALGALLFVDLERGAGLHGEAGYEAGQVGAFLPVPLGGMYAAAEVSTVNRKAALYELATVAAVLRVDTAAAQGPTADAGSAAAQQQGGGGSESAAG
ncbi:hypothetical protein Rsub_05134 [Raphidocelis subcapitata]|uniref:FIST domain-containing protein n=1 Tax=Raphidocelis subcapitata TaxID=307507 RepID=A0A2V0P6P6_9CHLO|nr:hypothetical protein Rsub_05134 [Raphidocelis subcapitata]|eukprot:GBF92765.1 hypothetical protein Rsub_05134 [Raphidocelis subcapitata]